MASLFDGTKGMEDIAEILSRMEANIPDPSSNSQKLWKLRRATNISSHNPSREKMLEKAVVMLAENGHMPGWFNECPNASGIAGPSADKRSCVDLVHWREADSHARLVELKWVELKWKRDSPSEAVRQILRYGAAYLFCRMHRNRLDKLRVWQGSVMDACDISLQVAAPARYYTDSGLRHCLSRARENLARFDIGSRIGGLSMSLDVLAFPEWFDRLPFANGEQVRSQCGASGLTEAGRKVRDAFDGLASVYPEAEGGQP